MILNKAPKPDDQRDVDYESSWHNVGRVVYAESGGKIGTLTSKERAKQLVADHNLSR